MISELVFTLYWKNLIHTRISNPFLKCFLPSKSFFFSFFRLALSLLTTVNLQWQWILGPMQPSSHVPQHSNFKLKMNWKITGTFLCECTPSERQSGWGLGRWTCNPVVQVCSSPISYLLDLFSAALSSTHWLCSVWLPFTSWES